jgi:hypothetical protein
MVGSGLRGHDFNDHPEGLHLIPPGDTGPGPGSVSGGTPMNRDVQGGVVTRCPRKFSLLTITRSSGRD